MRPLGSRRISAPNLVILVILLCWRGALAGGGALDSGTLGGSSKAYVPTGTTTGGGGGGGAASSSTAKVASSFSATLTGGLAKAVAQEGREREFFLNNIASYNIYSFFLSLSLLSHKSNPCSIS